MKSCWKRMLVHRNSGKETGCFELSLPPCYMRMPMFCAFVWGTWIWKTGEEDMRKYDEQLLKDVKEGRAETIEKMVLEDADYRRLVERQKEEWQKLEVMGLSAQVLEA